MIGGGLQEKVYGSHKGMTNVSKRMGQSSNGPIKRLGHTNGSGGGKNNLISEIYPRF